MPDVTLIPAIASFFGISTDEPFDFNLYEVEQEVEKITLKAYQHRRSGEFSEAERILRDGLKRFPGNDALVKPTLEKIPEIYFSKLELMAQLLDGEEAWVAAHKELGVSLEHSLRMLFVIGQHQQAKGQNKEAQATYMKGIKILEAIEAELSNPGWREYYEQFHEEIKTLT